MTTRCVSQQFVTIVPVAAQTSVSLAQMIQANNFLSFARATDLASTTDIIAASEILAKYDNVTASNGRMITSKHYENLSSYWRDPQQWYRLYKNQTVSYIML